MFNSLMINPYFKCLLFLTLNRDLLVYVHLGTYEYLTIDYTRKTIAEASQIYCILK